MAKGRVLIVDDDAGIRFAVRDFLEAHGHEVHEADGVRVGESAFRACGPDVVVLDYMLPDGNALDLLPRLKQIDSTVPVVILTGHGSIDVAVRAIREGAEQFLTKPVEISALLVVIERQLQNRRNLRMHLAGRVRQAREVVDPFFGESAAIRRLEEQALRVVGTHSPVLIQGETGTGKGVLARWLHANGPRKEEPFVDLNCAGLTREFLETELFGHEKGAFTGAVSSKAGLLEVAHRGVAFLDEIGDMDAAVQSKLLKALEEKRFRRLGDVHDRQVDVHLIAATHQDLRSLIREKKFRADLYFRISAIPISVPPLRERAEDVPALARRLLRGFAAEMARGDVRLSPESDKALMAYPWPGNVRELRNVLERAALLSERDVLAPGDFRFEDAVPPTADGSLKLLDVERGHIERVLRESGGRIPDAARKLGIPRSSLYQKVKKYRIATSSTL